MSTALRLTTARFDADPVRTAAGLATAHLGQSLAAAETAVMAEAAEALPLPAAARGKDRQKARKAAAKAAKKTTKKAGRDGAVTADDEDGASADDDDAPPPPAWEENAPQPPPLPDVAPPPQPLTMKENHLHVHLERARAPAAPQMSDRMRKLQVGQRQPVHAAPNQSDRAPR
jgi:hypothetical protein